MQTNRRKMARRSSGALLVIGLLPPASAAAPPPSFDFYVYSTSYQPNFCHGHSGCRHEGSGRRGSVEKKHHGVYPGCTHPDPLWKTSLTIHGLWPQYDDGTWPSNCPSADMFDPSVAVAGRLGDLELLWPNVKAAPPSDGSIPGSPYTDFWAHEWTKHGTCSGLKQEAYFNAALDAFVDAPDLIRGHYGGTVSLRNLEDAYDKDVLVVCQGGGDLSEVRMCLGRDESGMPTSPIACPESVLVEGNCGDMVTITAFEVDDELDCGIVMYSPQE
eukprot:CAMPEP_0194324192 /NCGR_PEP_ID=MMETSP0171-20130528/26800_1 /TAXON_ID=218684 /ORGANISM="Corethron pennatum, Strain L29A3" /LENGTH=271 /DNA_ID=CAMNT_0039083027 /DNA_START=98 /DNA_END=913 /DNA_ORIENTATION=+